MAHLYGMIVVLRWGCCCLLLSAVGSCTVHCRMGLWNISGFVGIKLLVGFRLFECFTHFTCALPIGLNIFYLEEKDWVGHTKRQYPLQKKYYQLFTYGTP